MIELEKKLLISKEEYDHILKTFGYGRSITSQINYYFDTEDLSMNMQNITCRIRLKDGKYQATMKQHMSKNDCSTETNMIVKNGIYDNSFVDMGLKLQGELITERSIIIKNENCEVVLDKNTYLGETDYEVEIEYAADHEDEARIVFQKITDVLMHHSPTTTQDDITNRINKTQSKSKRFFERRLNNEFHT